VPFPKDQAAQLQLPLRLLDEKTAEVMYYED
jgi:hypothetical protein